MKRAKRKIKKHVVWRDTYVQARKFQREHGGRISRGLRHYKITLSNDPFKKERR